MSAKGAYSRPGQHVILLSGHVHHLSQTHIRDLQNAECRQRVKSSASGASVCWTPETPQQQQQAYAAAEGKQSQCARRVHNPQAPPSAIALESHTGVLCTLPTMSAVSSTFFVFRSRCMTCSDDRRSGCLRYMVNFQISH